MAQTQFNQNSVLAICYMQNGRMDPGYPAFLFEGNSESISQSKKPNAVEGALSIVPCVYTAALIAKRKEAGIVFYDKKFGDPVLKKKVIPLDRIQGYLEHEVKSVFICGVFKNMKEFIKVLDDIKRYDVDNIVFVSDITLGLNIKEIIKNYKNENISHTTLDSLFPNDRYPSTTFFDFPN